MTRLAPFVLVFGLVLALVAPARADAPAATSDNAIRAELAREVAAWNAGDLDGFLAGYERAPTTLFVGRAKLYRGWDAIAAMYKQHYPDRRKMGALRFTDLEVRPLGPDHAVAVGRFELARPAADGGPASGWFTLTWHKSAAGWRIILDHTS